MSENTPRIELEVELPEHVSGPVKLANGDFVDIGDKIEHPTLGIGAIYRIATYHDELGILLCVEFANSQHQMIGLKLATKRSG